MSKKLIGLVTIFSTLVLAGCTSSSPTASYPNTDGLTSPLTASTSNTSPTKTYTVTDVAAHNSAASCWIIIDNNVYDVTRFIPLHPGGDQILTGCGKDMSSYMASMHKPVGNLLPQFAIGSVKP